MSHITKLKTTFRDPECILQALLDQGFKREEVLRSDSPMDVQGGGKAEIVVDKAAIQRATTKYPYTGMGFAKQKDGTYELLIDQYTFKDDWTQGLQQRYNRALTYKTAKAAGWVATETKGENGEVKISLREVRMAIPKGYKNNFETLKRACLNKDLCIMECQDKATGKTVYVVGAMGRDGQELVFSPLAKMFDGNPYEELNPPDSHGGFVDTGTPDETWRTP